MSTEQAGAVVIQVTAADFDRLCENSGKASGIAAGKNRWRFRDADTDELAVMNREWRYVYWTGRNYVNALLARSFLAAIGEEFQMASDEAAPDYGWVIFTDYESPVWVQQDTAP